LPGPSSGVTTAGTSDARTKVYHTNGAKTQSLGFYLCKASSPRPREILAQIVSAIRRAGKGLNKADVDAGHDPGSVSVASFASLPAMSEIGRRYFGPDALSALRSQLDWLQERRIVIRWY
jgi:hypothetical protein